MSAGGNGTVLDIVVCEYLVLREHEVIEPIKTVGRNIIAVGPCDIDMVCAAFKPHEIPCVRNIAGFAADRSAPQVCLFAQVLKAP